MRDIAVLFAITLLTASLTTAAGSDEEATASTQEERAVAVGAARILESDPLGEKSAEIRSNLTIWWIQVPDLSVTLCANLLDSTAPDKKIEAIVMAQPMFSSGAFIIEHPELVNDNRAVTSAGLEGALKAYTAIVAKLPKMKSKNLDELVALRGAGKLGEYVDKVLPKCKKD